MRVRTALVRGGRRSVRVCVCVCGVRACVWCACVCVYVYVYVCAWCACALTQAFFFLNSRRQNPRGYICSYRFNSNVERYIFIKCNLEQ